MGMKSKIKTFMGKSLIGVGAWEWYLRRMAQRKQAIVLTYHRVIEKWDRTLDYSQPGMVVTADTLDRQLAFLKKHFNIVPLSYFIDRTPNSRHPKPLCAITFDDGWRDNYEIAFPILQKHSVPATIFLTTDFIGTDRTFWHTELMYLLMHGDVSRYRLLQYVLQAYPSAVSHRWRRLVRSGGTPTAYDLDPLIEAVKATCGEDEIDNLIRDLRHILGTSGSLLSERRFFLEWDQVREMANGGPEIGSHGCSHRILTRVNLGDAKEELARSKVEIEARIGQAVLHFAFPDGAANAELVALVGLAGYRTASLCRKSRDRRGVAALVLQRLGMHEGVSQRRDGSFSEAALVFWLLRAPREIWT